MKTTMKFFTYGFLFFALIASSCSKDGDTGLTGPQGTSGTDGIDGLNGTDGIDGSDGVDGVDGNANVQLLEFEARTFTGTTSFLMPGITGNDLDNNLFLGYYARIFFQTSESGGLLEVTQWIPVPGLSHNGDFETNVVIEGASTSFDSNYMVSVYDLDGNLRTTTTTFTKFKIFIVPPSSISGKNSRSQLSGMSYKALMDHLGLLD
ncbi:hypothetical protein [Cellulophaga sp. L1A9]|uniref:hypothetical protein n=1 Tax=Cellulophaga sp. L1A9 TaxID=2686362 RepID=UPI00131BFFFE|nr:hypothetical protein [Cellulophaga sp. L1A9]